MDNQKRYSGKMRPLWVLAGAYLLYLAFQQGRLVAAGEAETRGQVVLCIVSAAVFAAVGAWVIWREWKYARTPETDASGLPDDSGNENTPDDSHGDSTPDDSGDGGGSDA